MTTSLHCQVLDRYDQCTRHVLTFVFRLHDDVSKVAGYNLLLRTLVVLSCGMDVDTGEPVEGGAGWPFAQVILIVV